MSVENAARWIKNGERPTVAQIYNESERAVIWLLRYGEYSNQTITMSEDTVQDMIDGDSSPWIPTATDNAINPKPKVDRNSAKKGAKSEIEDASEGEIFTILKDHIQPTNYSPKGLLSSGTKIGVIGAFLYLISEFATFIPETFLKIIEVAGFFLILAIPFSIILAAFSRFGGNKVRLITGLGIADVAKDELGDVRVELENSERTRRSDE